MKLDGSCLDSLARDSPWKGMRGLRRGGCPPWPSVSLGLVLSDTGVFTTHAMTNMYYLYQNARYGPTTRPLYLFSFLAKMALILAQTNLGLWAASTGFQIPVFL
jgi:hypothetical protein